MKKSIQKIGRVNKSTNETHLLKSDVIYGNTPFQDIEAKTCNTILQRIGRQNLKNIVVPMGAGKCYCVYITTYATPVL